MKSKYKYDLKKDKLNINYEKYKQKKNEEKYYDYDNKHDFYFMFFYLPERITHSFLLIRLTLLVKIVSSIYAYRSLVSLRNQIYEYLRKISE